MKILAGKFKKRNFYMPRGIRPSQDKLRKALFDYLGGNLTGLRFIDLFAGSGAVGLEALSRGCHELIFVENNHRHAAVIRDNLASFGIRYAEDMAAPVSVWTSDAFAAVKMLASKGRTFDLVFADPPYRQQLGKKILKTLGAHDIVKPNSYVIIQHDRKETLPSQEGSVMLIRERRYGTSLLSIYHKSG